MFEIFDIKSDKVHSSEVHIYDSNQSLSADGCFFVVDLIFASPLYRLSKDETRMQRNIVTDSASQILHQILVSPWTVKSKFDYTAQSQTLYGVRSQVFGLYSYMDQTLIVANVAERGIAIVASKGTFNQMQEDSATIQEIIEITTDLFQKPSIRLGITREDEQQIEVLLQSCISSMNERINQSSKVDKIRIDKLNSIQKD